MECPAGAGPMPDRSQVLNDPKAFSNKELWEFLAEHADYRTPDFYGLILEEGCRSVSLHAYRGTRSVLCVIKDVSPCGMFTLKEEDYYPR